MLITMFGSDVTINFFSWSNQILFAAIAYIVLFFVAENEKSEIAGLFRHGPLPFIE